MKTLGELGLGATLTKLKGKDGGSWQLVSDVMWKPGDEMPGAIERDLEQLRDIDNLSSYVPELIGLSRRQASLEAPRFETDGCTLGDGTPQPARSSSIAGCVGLSFTRESGSEVQRLPVENAGELTGRANASEQTWPRVAITAIGMLAALVAVRHFQTRKH